MKTTDFLHENTVIAQESPEDISMVVNNLHTIMRVTADLANRLSGNEELDEWVKEKIAVAKAMMTTVEDYVASQQEMGGEEESLPSFDTNSAEQTMSEMMGDGEIDETFSVNQNINKSKLKQGVAEGAPIVVMPSHKRLEKKHKPSLSRGMDPAKAQGEQDARDGKPYNNPYPFKKELGAPGNWEHNSYKASYDSVKQGVAEGNLKEFAPNGGGNGGDDYLRTLASAWYNQDLSAIAHEVKKDKNPKKKGIMDRVIDAQVAVEKMLARGVVCGDGKVRKFSIDYNSDFDGVVMTYEDYAEYSDYGDDGEDIDSRTGKPWPNSKYDQIEFTDDQLDEGMTENRSSWDSNMQGVAEGFMGNVKDTELKNIDPDNHNKGEGDFVKNQLHTIKRVVTHLENSIGSEEDLPDWVQSEIAKVTDKIVNVMNYSISKKEQDIGSDSLMKEQGMAEGHADQQRKVFKKNGKPVGEVGIDRESSPGNGQWYMKCYSNGIDNVGYDSYEEAVAELKHCIKQGMAEGKRTVKENATGGVTGASSVAVSMTTLGEKGGFSKQDLKKKFESYGNSLSRGGPVKPGKK